MAEVKIEAFVNFLCVQFADENLFNEMMRAHDGEIARERQNERGIDPRFCEEANAALSRRDQLEIFVGMKDPRGMRVEGDYDGFGAGFAGALNHLREHRLMREVDAIEVTDAYDRRAKIRGY